MKYERIVLDFDGVVVDSNALKYEAWNLIFATESRQINAALAHVLASSREVSRYEILQRIGTRVGLTSGNLIRFVNGYAARYQKMVEDEILRTYRPEQGRALERLSANSRLYLSSATPQAPLEQTVMALGLNRSFSSIYGSPPGKTERLRQLLSEWRASPAQVLVVGDGESDRASAIATGCRFIGIPNMFNQWSRATGIELVESLVALPDYLEGSS